MTGGTTAAPGLRTLIGAYLATRRALGFTLEGDGRVLFAFADHLDRSTAGDDQHVGPATGAHVTVEQALRFATASPAASARSLALRLSAIGLFARWAQLLDPRIEVPQARLLPARASRPTPFTYTEAPVGALLAAAAELRPPIRAVTFATLLALQAATGIRTGEALGLDVDDLDLGARSRQATLTVTGKYEKTRTLPLHPTVATGLGGYRTTRAALLPTTNCPALLINTHGRRLGKGSVHPTFRAVADLDRAGGGVHREPPQVARPATLGGRRGYAPCRVVLTCGDRVGRVFVRIIPAVGVTAPASRASR